MKVIIFISCIMFALTTYSHQAISNLMVLLLGEGYQASLFPESKCDKLF